MTNPRKTWKNANWAVKSRQASDLAKLHNYSIWMKHRTGNASRVMTIALA